MDLLFDSATVTATSIDHGSVFNDTTNPDVIVTGLVDDLGGATTDLGRAVGPNWALLARVPVTVTGSGPFTFSLNHGAFAFALAGGLPPLVNAAVNVTETLSVDVVVVDDGVNCTSDSCDEVNHVAIHTPNDASCGNGLFCDGVETCNVTLDCQAGTAPTIDDGVTCTDDSCDEVNDVIVHAVNDSLCDNDQFCDGVETCNATLDCQAGTAPTIDDGVTCTDDSCDEVNAIIVNTPNDTNCNDSIVCTTDVCDLVFDCVNSALIYDLDESNLVDFSDFALFAPRFATFAGDLDYDACSDFYFDDVIDAADVSFFGTAFGKTCDDTTIVTPDTGHLPPLGCPAGPLGVLAAVEKDGDSVTLEVNAVVVGLPSLFTSSDTFPVSHTDPIGIRSTFFVEVWVRISGETAMGITGGSLSLHVDPELATPISASVDDGFPWFQDGEIDASTGSVINLSGGTLQTGAAVGEWVRFASVEFMSHHPGARSLDLVQGHMVFAQYAVGAMAPEAVTLTGTQITIEVIKRQRRSHREGG